MTLVRSPTSSVIWISAMLDAGYGIAEVAERLGHDPVEHRGELRTVSPLTGGDHQGQQSLTLVTGQVDLGGPPAPGTAQTMVARFDHDPPGGSFCACGWQRAPAAC